jgi:hypothetical protein
MVTNRWRASRLITRHSLIITLWVAGCSQPQAAEHAAQPAEPPAVVIAPPAGEAKPQPGPAPKAEPPAPGFAFPADLGGRALPRVVAPDVSRPLPADRPATAPRPRAIPAKVLNPEPVARVNFNLPPLLPAKFAASRPADPPEKLPVTFGSGTHDLPAKPALPVAPVSTPRARDANLPPPAPVLGRPASDRVPFDDPTAELGNAAVAGHSVKTALAPSEFRKMDVPDPFELGAQVKPKVPMAAEPSPAPVVVNPPRVK